MIVLPNTDNCHSKTYLAGAGLPGADRPSEMLFDLVNDPQEFDNLAGQPGHAEIQTDLAARLQSWMESTDDPILKGPVPPPPGSRITPHDQYDPKLPDE